MKKTIALFISGILASAVPASGFLIAGWDTWAGGSTDTYDATVVNGVSAQAVGTQTNGIGWGPWANATFNNGASGDGTWGTASGEVLPSTSTADATSATGLRNSTESGELTITITNTSGSALDLASFHFDGAETRDQAPGDWTLSILAGSAVSEGLVASGVLPIPEDVLMPAGGFDIDLSGLADTTFDDGETVIFELAFTGGAGDGAGGQNAMIDNVAVMAVRKAFTMAVDTIDHVRDNIGSETSQQPEYNTGSSNRVGGAGSATSRFIDNAILGFILPTLGSLSDISAAEFAVTLTGTAVVDATIPDRNFSTDLYLFNAGVTPSELAPDDVLWNTDGLDERGNVSLVMGAFATPDTEIGSRLMASFPPTHLEDFYNEDGTPTQSTIWFRMNLDNRSTITTRYEYTLTGAELTILPDDPNIVRPFDEVIGAVNFRDDYYRSSWFGRYENIGEDTIHSGLGRLWTGAANNASSMFLWAHELNQWIWTTASVFPRLYLVGDDEWIYAHEDPDYGTFLWNYNNNEWVELNPAGWEYPLSNDELAQRFSENISDFPHPRILLSLDHLPILRENIAEGWLADAYALLKTTADQQKANFASSFDFDFSATVGRRMQDTIATLALVGYIEDDDSYIRSAIDFTLHQIRTYSYDEFANNNPGSPPLSLGDVVHGLAIGYDWLYPHMTTSQRSEIHTALETLGGMLYTVVSNRYTGSSDVADSSNHNSVGNGGLGMGALALGDKPDWFSQALRQIRRYLQVSSDAEGWNFEGRSYFNYGGWGGFPFASAVIDLGGPDLFAEQPKYYSVAVDYVLRQMPPYDSASGTAATMPFIMRSRDEVGLWTWLNANGSDGNGTYGAGGSGISFLPYTLLWADPYLQPLHPMDADLPLDKVFPSDRALFRDGWHPMDAVVTFTTGWAWHPGHRVRNDNSFNFYALGEQFAISPADAQTRMEVLNSLVMVDEPRRTLDPQEFRHGAAFETVETNEHFAYIKSDATESPVYYLEPDGWTAPEKRKVTYAMRHLLFARSPEGLAEPYMLIVDDLTARAESAKFSWLFQTQAQNTPDLGASGNSFQVTGNVYGNLLNVEFLAPAGLSNELLSHEGRDEIKGRWSDERINNTLTTISTSTTGKSVRFIALLRAHEAGTNPPSYTFTGTETDGQIVVVLSDGTTDTITINGDEISFSRASP